MKVPVSWLRECADLPGSATVADIAARMAGVGFEVAAIDGEVIDFEITANRPDCLSVRGLAREAATAYAVQGARGPEVQGARSPEVQGAVPVTIESPLCGRYALALADVTVGPSPGWLADRLTACGIRPINTIVDITNYVLIEMGHPMHAFDGARLAGPAIVVRQARAGERLTTLDGQARVLDASMLVIADRDDAVAIAGVMGGAASEVSPTTTRIALESAWFQPATVRATSKRLGLKTEASTRFERGADINAAVAAIERALSLLEQIGAGQRAGGTTDVYPAPVAPTVVPLRPDRLARLLGDQVPAADVERILGSLGFTVARDDHGWQVTVPTARVDVAREADLIEEVGRHWGVNRVPATFPSLRSTPRPSDAGVMRARRLRRLLCGAGLQEAVTFTFMEHAAAAPFVTDPATLVRIANPLSEKFAVLRPSLIPGLLDSLIYNRRRGLDDVRLFEAGAVFSLSGEGQRVGWVLCGARDVHWSVRAESVDLFDALGIAEVAADAWGLTLATQPADDTPWFVQGRSAALLREAARGQPPTRVGTAGQLPADLTHARGLPAGVVVVAGELDLAAFAGDGTAPRRVSPLPRFPSVVRDLSLLVDVRLQAASVRATIRQRAPATLVGVREFDRYQGKGVPDGQVSLSVRLTFRDTGRTLTDTEVDQAIGAIVTALQMDHGAVVRRRSIED